MCIYIYDYDYDYIYIYILNIRTTTLLGISVHKNDPSRAPISQIVGRLWIVGSDHSKIYDKSRLITD